jgi:hypothetical protein
VTERGQQPVGDIGRQVRNAVTLHTLPSKIGDLVAGVRRRGGVASLPKGVAVLVDSHKALSYQRALATFTRIVGEADSEQRMLQNAAAQVARIEAYVKRQSRNRRPQLSLTGVGIIFPTVRRRGCSWQQTS